jgi:hypothetical protein
MIRFTSFASNGGGRDFAAFAGANEKGICFTMENRYKEAVSSSLTAKR